MSEKPPLVTTALDLTADLPLYVRMECPDSFASPIHMFVEGGPYQMYGSFTALEPSSEDFGFEAENRSEFKVYAPESAVAFKNIRTVEVKDGKEVTKVSPFFCYMMLVSPVK